MKGVSKRSIGKTKLEEAVELPNIPINELTFDQRFLVIPKVKGKTKVIDKYSEVYAFFAEKDVPALLEELPSLEEYKRRRFDEISTHLCLLAISFIYPSDKFERLARTGDIKLNRTLWWDYFLGKYSSYEEYKSIARAKKEECELLSKHQIHRSFIKDVSKKCDVKRRNIW